MSEEHAAKKWVEEKFPDARPSVKALLILAYGAGLDAGLAEAQEIIADFTEQVRDGIHAPSKIRLCSACPVYAHSRPRGGDDGALSDLP